MKTYHLRTTRLTLLPAGEPIFSEMATHLEIEDEAGGEYLRITQQSDSTAAKEQSIALSPEEWPPFREAVETLLAGIKDWES